MPNILSKIVVLWLFFWLQVNIEQSKQNNKFAISLEYLKKAVKDEVDFLHKDNHQSFLQICTFIFGVCGQACPKYKVCSFFFNISRKKSGMKWIACM